MILNDETGLPEVPEGHYWEVVEANWPLPSTLRVELRVEKEVTKTKTVLDELPKKWYQTNIRTEKRTVEYTAMDSELVASESLVDEHVHYFDKKDTRPTGPGWEPERRALTTAYWSTPPEPVTYVTNVTADSTYLRYYRRHPNTPESIRTAAEKIYKHVEKKREKDAALLREKEERANLIGKYPPKTLKG